MEAGKGRDVDCFVFRNYPILGLSPRDFVANCRYVVVKTNGMLKSKGHKGPSIILTSTKIKVDLRVVTKFYSETVCRALNMTNNRHRRKEKREVILSSVQEIFSKL